MKTTTEQGKIAEEYVATFLVKSGHKLVALNWRTKWCEIDIVTKKKNCVYFTEVKYRSSPNWGSGLDYITPAKLKQMSRAAELWLHESGWRGECVLQAVEVSKELEMTFVTL